MKKSLIAFAVATYATAALADAAFEVRVHRVGCESSATVIVWEITGKNTGTGAGLAGFSLDLTATLDGNPYSLSSATVSAPADGSLASFSRPAGFTHDGGYDGSTVGGKIIQIGGAQNTIGNAGSGGPFPVGTVKLGLCQGVEQVLARVQINNPPPGSLSLAVTNVNANIINPGQPSNASVYFVSAASPVMFGETTVACGACCRGGICGGVMTRSSCNSSFYVCDVNAFHDGQQPLPHNVCGTHMAGAGCSETCGPCLAGCFYGDADGNGTVNAADRGFISANIGQTSPLMLCLYDMDDNGTINAGDRGFVAVNIGLCEPLRNFQNASGLNPAGTGPDPRYVGVYMGDGTQCTSGTCGS